MVQKSTFFITIAVSCEPIMQFWRPLRFQNLIISLTKSIYDNNKKSRARETLNLSPDVDNCTNPILDKRISGLCLFVRRRHAQTPSPGFWNGVDWRALVED